jgi:uroporphyrinogen-III synthase
MARVLVIRARDDAERTAQALAARGHRAIIAPLIEIVWTPDPVPPPDNVQAILATSANAVAALLHQRVRRDLQLYAVGDRTAEMARAGGFTFVRSAGGDSASLAALVAAQADRLGGPLFHGAGAETRGDLASLLEARGFDVRTSVLYEAVAVANLPAVLRDGLQNDAIDMALFFSPRSAAIFAARVAGAGLVDHCRRIRACCISRAVAGALSPIAFANVAIADSPAHDAVIALADATAC